MFSGLHTAVSGLRSGQAGLYVTGHNMANHSTKGYTRQLTHQAHFVHRTVGTNANGPMQIGLGTNPTGIRQVRNPWLDKQFRETAPRMMYWDTRLSTHNELDAIFGELEGQYRIQLSLQHLHAALNELNNDVQARDTRQNFLSQAGTFITRAEDAQRSLREYQMQLNDQVISTVHRINQIITDVHDLNNRIVIEKSMGLNPNDFLDWRNVLLDELSGLLEVTIFEEPRGAVSILVTHGGHNLLSSGGHISRLGVRQAAPMSPFVEPVFTTESRTLEFSEFAIGLFNWDRLGRNYTTVDASGRNINGGQSSHLLSLISSRGLGPSNYATPAPPETREDIIARLTTIPTVPSGATLPAFATIAGAWSTFLGGTFPTTQMIPDPGWPTDPAFDPDLPVPLIPAIVTGFEAFLNTPPHLRGPVPAMPGAITAASIAYARAQIDAAPLYPAAGGITAEEAAELHAFLDNLEPGRTIDGVQRAVHDFDLVSRRTFDMNVAIIPQVKAQFDTLVNHMVNLLNNALTTNISNGGAGSPPRTPPILPHHPDGIYHGQQLTPAQFFYDAFPDGVVNLQLFVQIRQGDGYTLGNLRINPFLEGQAGATRLALTFDGESDQTVMRHILHEWNRNTIEFSDWSPSGINTFYNRFITLMGTGGNEALSNVIRVAEELEFTDFRRKSISAVSIEEEMSNMIRFQHAYNSSARVISIIDSMIERLVNGLGAGRG
ncbi:MAG: hypothetical protein FWB74_05575 [Defluviitaleaceae bacterium]|nr:hypothetical protein [Defluviitaleaceae bacterium]